MLAVMETETQHVKYSVSSINKKHNGKWNSVELCHN